MTASRYKVPKGFLDVAGQRLGLNLVDLFGDDAEGKANLEGFEPVYNAQTQFTSKGRGGALSYKTPKVPTTTYTSEFSLIPERKEAAPAGPTGPTTKSYNWNAYGNLGGPGYGAKDLEKALGEGFSEQDVKNYLQQNRQLFGPGRLNLAEDLQKQFGFDYSFVNPVVQSEVLAGKYGTPPSLTRMADPSKFANPLQTQEFKKAENVAPITAGISTAYGIDPKYFGGEDLTAARQQGFSNQQIKDYLDQNPSLLREQNIKGGGGLYDELAKSLAPTSPAPAAVSQTTMSQGLGGSVASSPGGDGHVDRFRYGDMSRKEYADPLQTQDFREADREEVKPRGQISTEFGIDPSFFGGEDLEYARKQGFQDREIKEFLDKNIQGLLRAQNLPGGGGLYDQLRA